MKSIREEQESPAHLLWLRFLSDLKVSLCLDQSYQGELDLANSSVGLSFSPSTL